jgi:hypothetical protein
MEEKLVTPERVAKYGNVTPKTLRECLRASPHELVSTVYYRSIYQRLGR